MSKEFVILCIFLHIVVKYINSLILIYGGLGGLLTVGKSLRFNTVNIKKFKCIEPNCSITATFNFADLNRPLYCKKHKKEDMINIRLYKYKIFWWLEKIFI
mgnify:CR=1 FL=1